MLCTTRPVLHENAKQNGLLRKSLEFVSVFRQGSGQAALLFSINRSTAVLQESFRQGWKLPSLLVFVVGKGQHTQGLPKLREAVLHLLRVELHMIVIDGAHMPSRSDASSEMSVAHPVQPHCDSVSAGHRAYVACPGQVLLNPGRLAVEFSSLVQWVRRSRDCKPSEQ